MGEINIVEFHRRKHDHMNLKRSLKVPSNVHGYSLSVEYIKKWFLSKFEKDYFKSVYIEGKYVFEDFHPKSRTELLKMKKPMLSITPTIDVEHNRNRVDQYDYGDDFYVKKTTKYNDAIFQDISSNIFFGFSMKTISMDFNFKIKVSSRARQLDLLDYIKLVCRIGSTQGEYITTDFHIPKEIILTIAEEKGYEIVKKDGDYFIKDIHEFLHYLNSHCVSPITYKYRAINGQNEFFIRANNIYTHIDCTNGISIDDGDRNGMVDSSFNIEFQVKTEMVVPMLYFLYSSKDVSYQLKLKEAVHGLYNLEDYDITPPEADENGWNKYLFTKWEQEDKYVKEIDFAPLLNGGKNISQVIGHTKKMGISPHIFINVKIYNGCKPIDCKIDWSNFIIKPINPKMTDTISKIAIYVDFGYMNEQLETIQNFKTRIEK